MQTAERTATHFIAFISYAREDEPFAQQLEREIEKSRTAKLERTRRVFRDRSDFTGSEYHRALESHLTGCENLIVVCSPAARQSKWVDEEIRLFARLHGPERIFPVLRAGVPDNEADEQKAFPRALLEVRPGIPLASDFRTPSEPNPSIRHGAYESEWYKLLGSITGLDPSELREREERREVRALRWRVTASVIALVVMAGVAMGALGLWRRAAAAEQRAERAEAAAKAMSRKAETELAEVKRSPVAAPTLAPRVYFHIRQAGQRGRAEALAASLASAGWVVPGIELLDVGPSVSELRYFRDTDSDEAVRIADALRSAGTPVTPKKVSGYESSTKIRPGHYELWLAPGAS
jgi:hypothetical protein